MLTTSNVLLHLFIFHAVKSILNAFPLIAKDFYSLHAVKQNLSCMEKSSKPIFLFLLRVGNFGKISSGYNIWWKKLVMGFFFLKLELRNNGGSIPCTEWGFSCSWIGWQCKLVWQQTMNGTDLVTTQPNLNPWLIFIERENLPCY